MYNIKVVNRKNLSQELGWIDIYVGRPSVLGNPYHLKNESNRDMVISQYRRYLWQELNKPDSKVKDELYRIAGILDLGYSIRLVCFCYPKKCHADIIVNAVTWIIKNRAKAS